MRFYHVFILSSHPDRKREVYSFTRRETATRFCLSVSTFTPAAEFGRTLMRFQQVFILRFHSAPKRCEV